MFRSATHITDQTQTFFISWGKAKTASLNLDVLVRRTPRHNRKKISTINTNNNAPFPFTEISLHCNMLYIFSKTRTEYPSTSFKERHSVWRQARSPCRPQIVFLRRSAQEGPLARGQVNKVGG